MPGPTSLLRDLAHELRDALAPVSTALELLRTQRAGQADAVDACARAARALESASAALDAFVFAGDWAFGMPPIAPAPTTLGDILARALGSLPGALHARCVPAREGGGAAVAADPALSARVVGTMIAHSAVAAAAGGELSLRCVPGSGGGAIVVGFGPGIPADAIAGWLLDYRARTGPAGLALRTARHIMERQQGRLELACEGQFWSLSAHFAAPGAALGAPTAVVGTAGAVGPAERTPAAGPAARPLPAGARVLVVEDNERVRQAYAEGLAALGYVVAEAATGAAAIAAAASGAPHAVVIDIHLPDTDGFSLARRLRARAGAGLRLVMLSGVMRDDAVLAEAQRAGFDATLDKTAGPRALDAVLRGTT